MYLFTLLSLWFNNAHQPTSFLSVEGCNFYQKIVPLVLVLHYCLKFLPKMLKILFLALFVSCLTAQNTAIDNLFKNLLRRQENLNRFNTLMQYLPTRIPKKQQFMCPNGDIPLSQHLNGAYQLIPSSKAVRKIIVQMTQPGRL